MKSMDEIVIPAGESVKKLENFLKKTYPIGYIRKLFRKNAVRLDGRRPKPGDTIEPGQRIQIFIPYRSSAKAGPKTGSPPGDIPVVYEDAELLVVNKPSGLAVHEAHGILKRDTLLGRLESRYRPLGFTLKLVHRLDKNTSGLVVLAKTARAARELESLFAEGGVEKEYLCLIAGRLHEFHGTIDSPLPGREGQPVRAVTRYKTELRFPETTLVRVTIETGRMHQIRLHFAQRGYPVVLDDKHGDFQFNRKFRARYGLKRLFLHASRLALGHAGRKHIWTAPLAADLQATLDRLKMERQGAD
jgi:23S rRNA pseudouridine955/2504/2580 synthase